MTQHLPATDTKQETPERTLMRIRYDALMLELSALRRYLGIDDRQRVMCPQCLRERNKAA